VSGSDGINLVWLVGALVLVASALSVRRVGFGMFLRTLLGWAAIVLLVVFAVGHRYELAAAWSALSSRLGLEDQRVEGTTVRIRMSPDGHFWARVTLNGVERRMLIDSGATVTAISQQTAKDATVQILDGLPAILETANGRVAAQRGRISELALGPLKMQDVGVVVSPSFGELDVLGMNFLSRLHSWRVEGNVLVLEPVAPEDGTIGNASA
jgi:aspartyl protease family protein